MSWKPYVAMFAIGCVFVISHVASGQRIADNLVVLYDFSEGKGNIVFDRAPSLGASGDPVNLSFYPNELNAEPIAGQFGDRPGLISWGDSWLNINKEHPVDDGTAHGTADAAFIWAGEPGTASKIVDRIVESGEFTIEAWVRPESIDNRSNPGRIAWMTVEGIADDSNFVLGQQSCCDGGGMPGGIQVRLNTDQPGVGSRVTFNSEGFLFDEGQLIQIVHTHDSANEESRVYVNREREAFDDEPVIDEIVFGDNLEGWDPEYVFAVGNDPYRFSRWFGGELHMIAIYSKAFSTDEIGAHFELGPGMTSTTPGDFDGNGVLDAADIDLLTAEVLAATNPAAFDLNNDSLVDQTDRVVWVSDLKNTYFGDSNLDGEFNSSDFVAVFTASEYEDAADGNSTWATGDWNGDGDFSSSDFVTAFVDAGFEQGPRVRLQAVPEPNVRIGLLIVTLLAVLSGKNMRHPQPVYLSHE